eukprot:g2678.t1
MNQLANEVSHLQSQLSLAPSILHTVSSVNDGIVTVSAYSPGSKRDEDVFSFSLYFKNPDQYPESQALLMSDDTAIDDMLSAVPKELTNGVTLEVLLSRVLALFGHEPKQLSNLFMSFESTTIHGKTMLSQRPSGLSLNVYTNLDETNGGEGYSNNVVDEEEEEEFVLPYISDSDTEDCQDNGQPSSHEQGNTKEVSEANNEDNDLDLNIFDEVHSSEVQSSEDRQVVVRVSLFTLLSDELESIKSEGDNDMIVDIVDNDLCHWKVELSGFEDGCPLADDLAELRARFGYSSIQLYLIFGNEGHLSNLPRVEVLRPRLIGFINSTIDLNHVLKFQDINPEKSKKELIKGIKNFIQQHARVDYGSKYNSPELYPQGAYTTLETQLERLAALSEVAPYLTTMAEHTPFMESCHTQVDLQTTEANESSEKEASKQKLSYWAAGTGYGFGNHRRNKNRQIWNAQKALTDQKERDIKLQTLLVNMTNSLSVELKEQLVESSNDDVSNLECSNDILLSLSSSCLIPFLIKELNNVAFTNMCERALYFLSIIKLINELCHPVCASMLCCKTSEDKSIFQCLNDIEDQAKCYAKVLQRSCEEVKDKDPDPSDNSAPCSPFSLEDTKSEESLGMTLAQAIINCIEMLKHIKSSEPSQQLRVKEDSISADNDTYEERMKQYQVDFCEDLVVGHVYESWAGREETFPKDRLVRLGREISGLKSLLPLNRSSSIFVRIDEQNQTIWTALIVGPEDTPYSGGCFIFDIYFPPTYPHTPPNVVLRTTGGGQVRFNPNLYECGTVCLSLLGTWSGAAGETWDPNASSAFQLLVSIQSLILVDEPYFNEPGYETQMNSEAGNTASRLYNQDIREQTIHRAMIDHLKNPTGPFAETLLSHFRLRREDILDTCRQWIEESVAVEDAEHNERLKALVLELEGLLNELDS